MASDAETGRPTLAPDGTLSVIVMSVLAPATNAGGWLGMDATAATTTTTTAAASAGSRRYHDGIRRRRNYHGARRWWSYDDGGTGHRYRHVDGVVRGGGTGCSRRRSRRGRDTVTS